MSSSDDPVARIEHSMLRGLLPPGHHHMQCADHNFIERIVNHVALHPLPFRYTNWKGMNYRTLFNDVTFAISE